MFVVVPELLRAIRNGYKGEGDTAEKLVQAAETAPLLVLDDLGAEKPTEWVQEQLFIIINRRYEELLPTLITTNCSMAELIDRIGRRTADRILEMTTPINIKAADYRMKA
jgi:DNA replication protein DnaC